MSERVGQPPPTVWVVLKESQNQHQIRLWQR
jgi:hypothetical protein